MRKQLKFGLIAAFWALSTPVSVNLAQPLSHSPNEPNTNATEDPWTSSGRGSHVSVKDFTKCDGVGDDYEGLQLAARSAAGGVLRFPDEPTVVCQISRPILLASETTVRGEATLRPTPNNLSKPMLIQFANRAANVTIEGMTIDGGGRDFPNEAVAVRASGGDHLVVENVKFQHIRGTAFAAVSDVTDSGVRKSRFTDIGNHWKTSHLIADRKAAIVFCCGSTASNRGNFATANTLSDIGLDAISATEQNDFLASGNICRLSDGQLTARWQNPQPVDFAACIYANHGTPSLLWTTSSPARKEMASTWSSSQIE
jgi:hypothetical protein